MVMTKKTPRKTLPDGLAKVLKRLHNPVDVILLCVRWYVVYLAPGVTRPLNQ